MIDILINMADNLDKKGLHSEASKIDRILRKIAGDLEKDYFSGIKNEDDYDSEKPQESDAKEYPEKADLNRDGKLSSYERKRSDAIQKAIKKRKKKMKNDSSDAGWGG